ncbi:MAG: hypothetical protein HY812_13925 [Planctomycetes bacterium]|nr:hypothetical protein [Planctomycetota bacterium]
MNERIVLYVDGGLDGAERAAFEERLAEEPLLRAEVKKARVLRGLIAGLPRKKAVLPVFDVLLEKLDAEPRPELRAALGLLRRAAVPEDLGGRVRAALRRSSRPLRRAGSWWPAALSAAAAALLLASSLVLYGGARPKRPLIGPRNPAVANLHFEFDLGRDLQRPGGGGR